MNGHEERKINPECSGRLFHEVWSEKYGIIEQNKKAFCCIYQGSIVTRSYNTKSYFEIHNQNLYSMTCEEKNEIIRREVKQQEQQ